MSYCRWSSMNWMCDLYCYEDVHGGWTTHVADSRMVRAPEPPDPLGNVPIDSVGKDEWLALRKRHEADFDTIPIEPIGLPCDGRTFNDPTLEDFRARVVALKEMGYNAPDYLLGAIDDEIKEQNAP